MTNKKPEPVETNMRERCITNEELMRDMVFALEFGDSKDRDEVLQRMKERLRNLPKLP